MAKKATTANGQDGINVLSVSIAIPKEFLPVLRLVAARRANREGGRASVSAVISSVLRAAMPALEKEAAGK